MYCFNFFISIPFFFLFFFSFLSFLLSLSLFSLVPFKRGGGRAGWATPWIRACTQQPFQDKMRAVMTSLHECFSIHLVDFPLRVSCRPPCSYRVHIKQIIYGDKPPLTINVDRTRCQLRHQPEKIILHIFSVSAQKEVHAYVGYLKINGNVARPYSTNLVVSVNFIC